MNRQNKKLLWFKIEKTIFSDTLTCVRLSIEIIFFIENHKKIIILYQANKLS